MFKDTIHFVMDMTSLVFSSDTLSANRLRAYMINVSLQQQAKEAENEK